MEMDIKKTMIAILCLSVIFFSVANLFAFEDITTKIKKAYTNEEGALLIQAEAANGSPDGWLKVGSNNLVSNPAARMMYATALIALTTGKTCWVRIIPTAEGYWVADRISINQ
ncbi:MAG: hypothetical protein CDV28_12722 [Candidatus Electronema aureum]|uniref:Uncharacterized protein n=1 Tax=Candidatus Electronema aureum TaxID=2005002 RepID=A0A521G075_9BACT|nr:MAG: hypothetical protein CDV28_12722 [Candidatus Electronema aureum]